MRISRHALVALTTIAGVTLLTMNGFAVDGAADAGGSVLTALQSAITGNLGLVVGLALAILGIWTWVVKQETAAGIMLIIGGVLITISPGVFNTVRGFVDGVVGTASTDGGGTLTTVKPTDGSF